MNEDELRALMAEVDARPAPAGGCDAAALVAAGRAVARRRWVGASVLAVVAVLAVAGGGVAVSRMVGAARPAALATAAPPLSPVAPSSGFDPLVRMAALGWVPAGLPVRRTELSVGGQEYFAEPAVGRVPADVATVSLVLHRSGWQPDHPKDGDCRRGAPDGTVGNAPAYRLASPYPPGSSVGTSNCGAGLMWQYAPGSWAEVRVLPDVVQIRADTGAPVGESGASLARHMQVARRVAEHAAFGRHDPVRLPFTVSGLPAGYRLAASEMAIGQLDSVKVVGRGELLFTDGRAGRTYLRCRVTDAIYLAEYDSAITTVDGHPATFVADAPAQLQLVVSGVRGCEVSVDRRGPGGHAELTALYRTLHPVANPRDLDNWTDHPLG